MVVQAQLKPIIDGGTISEVFVLNGGYGYNSAPTLKVSGYGQNASVTPVITNGTITSIKINNGGSGFSTDTTFIDVIPTGQVQRQEYLLRVGMLTSLRGREIFSV